MLEQRKGECVEAFNAETDAPSKRLKYASPISLRLNQEEREQLEHDAGDRTLSAYIGRLGNLIKVRGQPRLTQLA